MTTQLIDVTPEVKLEVSIAGVEQTETLLFIPGLSMDLRQFLPQQRHFADSYRVVLVSLRGHGQSTAPPHPDPEQFTLSLLAKDIRVALQQLGIKRVHLVGNSTGGLVGYALMEQAPHVVASLTTFGTAAQMDKSGLAGWSIRAMTWLLGPRGMAWLSRRTASSNPEVATRVAEIMAQVPRPVLMALQANLIRYDFRPVLQAHPEIPVLLLKGAEDSAVNAVLGPTLAGLEKHPRGRVVEIEGGGHFLNMERPELFNQTLTDFLEEC